MSKYTPLKEDLDLRVAAACHCGDDEEDCYTVMLEEYDEETA